MRPNAGEVLALIYGCIDDINDLRLPDDAIEKRPDVILVGEGGCLDSLALTMLVLNIERQAAKISGREISLLDGRELDDNFARFATPAALAELVNEAVSP
jgi:acyl carrier protein